VKDLFVNTPPAGNDSFALDKDNDDVYARWRDDKLNGYPTNPASLIVELTDLNNPGDSEVAALKECIVKTNMALYASSSNEVEDEVTTKQALGEFGRHFGLRNLDANLCADEDGISALSVAQGEGKSKYIPYTNRPISWHTDGYYNKPEHCIRAMVLHCMRPAAEGGVNALLDPEIAYIHLRDENPELIRALMHPQAMTIPANTEGEAVIRDGQSGPVFSFPGDDAALHMRYTARTRSIEWRDDSLTAVAVAFLADFLKGDSPYIYRHRMATGEGVLCNNVLHNRTAFENDEGHQRLFLRARYFDRIAAKTGESHFE
jgi:hypothetical protein